ncbi:MAG: hypothetical protein RR494_08020 [Vagococcus sp.]|uniref:NUMOD1 domain-containing DNA-binding protein n=1 Tax=Vagococcus sp. TaxID=1933889 RepID=UPI002FC91F82
MKLELVELEYLVLNHENCKSKKCPTCDRIKELRELVGDNREYKYISEDVETGEIKKFKSRKDLAESIGLSVPPVANMLNSGDERNGHIVKRLKPRTGIIYSVIDEFGREKTFDSARQAKDFINVNEGTFQKILNTKASFKGYVVSCEVFNA